MRLFARVWGVVLFALFFAVGCGGGQGSGEGDPRAEAAGERASRAEGSAGRNGGSSAPESTVRFGKIAAQNGTTMGDTTNTSRKDPRERAEETTEKEGPTRLPSDTLTDGAVDGTGGPLARNRLVSYYGHPYSEQMGVLGQSEPQRMVEELKKQAEAYTKADPDTPAIPTIELIASVAQPAPGPDGLYLIRTPPGVIEEYAKLAEENDLLLLLDVQIGYSTIADEVEALMPFLKSPYVHLAIDPEYDMDPGEIPGQQFGSSSGGEIMDAARTLSELVEKENLPPKVLVVHQFQYDMITNKEAIRPVPNVETVLHADGFGTPADKVKKYDLLVREEPIQYGGFKLFYTQDTPLLSPEQVLKLEPEPAVVSYQ